MFSIFDNMSDVGLLNTITARFFPCEITQSAQTTPLQSTTRASQPDQDLSPLNILANEIAALVMGYCNELNVFASGNENVQKHKHCSRFLIKQLLDDHKIFNTISDYELKSINFENAPETLKYICEKRLSDINCLIGEIVNEVLDYNESYYPLVNQLKRCCDLLEQARNSLSLQPKIYAISYSIEFLHSLNIPNFLKNCKYDHTFATLVIQSFREQMERV